MDTRISGTTKLFGIIGTPVDRAGSPAMYNFCFDYYGLDCVYLAFDCREDQVKDTLAAAKRLQIRGLNVTMPCKREAARQVDRLSPAARFTGAVNTIVHEGGILTGHITDGIGFLSDLMDHGHTVAGKDIVLMGTGGAAAAILTQCALEGAASVTIFNRSREGLEKARAIGDALAADGVSCRMEYRFLTDPDLLHRTVRKASILINATPVGMAPGGEGRSLITDMSIFHRDLVVYDVICQPETTRLMEDALQNGCRKENVLGGRGMLLWQAAEAFRLYTGLPMPVKELKAFLAGKS